MIVLTHHVYVVSSPWLKPGVLKIGRTTDPKKRLLSYRSHLPNAQVLRVIEVEDGAATEKLFHDYFALRRIKGTEWFEITLEQFDEAVALFLEPDLD